MTQPQSAVHTVIIAVQCAADGADLDQVFQAVERVPGVETVYDIGTFTHGVRARAEIVHVSLPAVPPSVCAKCGQPVRS